MCPYVKNATMGAATTETYELLGTPCHLIRLALKRAYDIFLEEVGSGGLTPPQFSLVLAVHQNPRIKQYDLVKLTGSDRSTVAELVGRLVARGFLVRRRLKDDQRVNRLLTTDEGEASLRSAISAAASAEERIIAPIPEDRREEFMDCLKLIADIRSAGDGNSPELSARQ